MITGLIALFGSSAFGSIIGGLFAFLNKKTDIDMKKLDLAHEQARWGHDALMREKDLEYAKVEAQGRKEVAIVEGEASMETARFVAIGQSHEADRLDADVLKQAGKWKGWLVLGGAARAWIRPVLTVVLAGAAIYLNGVLIGRLTEGWDLMTSDQQYDAGMQAFAWITGQASAALGYWFVSRGTGK